MIISNCVINLSADKGRVLREAFRVLKPGGRLAVSDVVTRGEVPAEVRQNMLLWVGCIAGALGDEFRIRGEKALASVPKGEVVLLSGQKGPVHYLVPVQGDIAIGDKELRRAMAMASLQESWRSAESQGQDGASDDEIDEETRKVRRGKSKRKSPR